MFEEIVSQSSMHVPEKSNNSRNPIYGQISQEWFLENLKLILCDFSK